MSAQFARVAAARAARFDGPRGIRVERGAPPVPGAGEVRIRLEGCGVCASNLPVWEGRPWFDYPLPAGSPGHEGWGHVDAVGAGVAGLSRGDRVAALSQRAYADYDVAAADAVVRLPPELDGRPFPGEPLGCAMNIFGRSAIEPGQTVAIVGIGFLGAALTMLARDAGARVVAVSRRRHAREVAEACGASACIALGEDTGRTIGQARAALQAGSCERAIEAVGSQEALDVASALVGVRGRLVVAGYHQDGPRQVNMQDWNWRGIDVVNAHERDPARYVAGMREAVDAVLNGRLDLDRLITHRYPLDEIGAAFEALAARPDGFLKALVTTEPS